MRKILIVEDEQILSLMYQEVFAKAGFEVSAASSISEALKQAEKVQPDFILLDILLQDGRALSFLEEKKANEKIANIPTLAFSNFDDVPTKEKALNFGVLDYLLKTDFTPNQLVDKVKSYLS